MSEVILVIGASGQIGTELVVKLREMYGTANVVASDIQIPSYDVMEGGPFELLDILNKRQIHKAIEKHKVTQIYLLAALLSATAEHHPKAAWELNITGLLNILSICTKQNIKKLFWPSSIAVFGPNTPKENAPQMTIMDPNTVYGISKQAGERWCEYYHRHHGIDCRSIRYPGLIGHKAHPGGGTTDYAVHIFIEALKNKSYNCFLDKDATLPMMYMPDAIDATIKLMESESSKINIRSSYNVSGMSFSPSELAAEIQKHIKRFKCTYSPDSRQQLATSWPRSIDDSVAREAWGWKPSFNLQQMTADMLSNLKYHL
ncbi:MAG: NAD-dependent epimerase/dehydratase family protein [Flavobacteriales bacterium]|nr:NAD-dependent epimerase/dehydratase family protein [Flavobacteriales bacterium]